MTEEKKVQNKVLEHQDKNDIIRWLSDGETPKSIAEKLEKKYPLPHQKHLRPSERTLYSFKKDFMPNGKLLLASVVDAKTKYPKWSKGKLELQKELMNNSAYKAALEKITDEEINVRRELVETMHIMKDRIEKIYNKIDANDKIHHNDERLLLEYLKNIQILLQQHDQTNRADRAEAAQNVSINVSVVNEQASLIKDAVRETLEGIDSNLAVEFMERLSMKMRELQYIEQTGIIPLGAKI